MQLNNYYMNNKFSKDIIILGIETSCDDTSIGISKNNRILSNVVANQEIHAKYGGVVPEIASREHQKNIVPTLHMALKNADISLSQIDAISFTLGPGLMGSLLVGVSFAKSLSVALKKPLIAINHMEAHVLANCIDNSPEYPFICLTASGGHTQIVLVNNSFDMKLIGETKDDSAGETFDKCAKILGLNYPGGPEIEKKGFSGDKDAFKFTIPKMDKLDFSFSGLKSNFKQLIDKEVTKNSHFIVQNLENLCASIQFTIIQILIQKLELAIKKYNIKNIAISGGVAANHDFRIAINSLREKHNVNVLIPEKEYSTDNGAMIAIAGYYKFQKKDFCDLDVVANARYKLGS